MLCNRNWEDKTHTKPMKGEKTQGGKIIIKPGLNIVLTLSCGGREWRHSGGSEKERQGQVNAGWS